MTEEEIIWLMSVTEYVKKHPRVAVHVPVYAQQGANLAIEEVKERCRDMETIAFGACAKKFGKADELVKQKLEAQKGNLMFNWDWFFEKLGGEEK